MHCEIKSFILYLVLSSVNLGFKTAFLKGEVYKKPLNSFGYSEIEEERGEVERSTIISEVNLLTTSSDFSENKFSLKRRQKR